MSIPGYIDKHRKLCYHKSMKTYADILNDFKSRRGQIWADRQNGMKIQEIMDKYHLSRPRVQKILQDEKYHRQLDSKVHNVVK